MSICSDCQLLALWTFQGPDPGLSYYERPLDVRLSDFPEEKVAWRNRSWPHRRFLLSVFELHLRPAGCALRRWLSASLPRQSAKADFVDRLQARTIDYDLPVAIFTRPHCWNTYRAAPGILCLGAHSQLDMINNDFGDADRKKSIAVVAEGECAAPAPPYPARFLDVNTSLDDRFIKLVRSEDDWTVEAAKMADVYQGSYFTIAATSSPDGDGGLYLDSVTPATRVNLRRAKESSKPSPNTPNGEPPDACYIRYPVASPDTIRGGPLSSRAWVLQEQMLSTRLVHFTDSQMFYQCAAGLSSEDGVLYRTATPFARQYEDWKWEIGAKWWVLVTEYSRRSITRESDRMAAMTGIVKAFSQKTGTEFALAVLVEFTCKWEGPEYLSRLLSSKLVISARIKPLSLRIPPYASSFYRDNVGNTLDTRIGAGDGDPSGLLIHLDGPLKQADFGSLYLLRLYTVKCTYSRSPLDDFVLLLKREERKDGPVYRRLGAGHLARPVPPPYIPWSTSYLSALAEPSMETSTGSYQVGSQVTEPSFFDGIGMQKVEPV
ncbi:uncharacterized protein PG986_000572 [Apiospora aurea]|uniref:Heterokaryon incompatibility domain-containing protein n=1 Tax=Apiospora aurea TaxID=335848 RepID=A0ABR1QUC8_9PEZI